ncbi:TonB-dependent receptor [Aureibaculum sp. A20]|uniref:TonB-dependent receptor n=1 Tax=Aureibaculum flavum TaxID=2795986 RepID=A0ABS0WNN3_9FLAO|nr:TonB-dependent receptor [Aureibaculum flavum]MBJ2173572.1 TonB-dependent receptor [Aureibaculum flavum]
MMKLKIAMIALVMICTQSVLAQTKTVSGTVIDSDGMTLPGVTILVVGTSNGVTTDFDGKYQIEDVSATDQLSFSFIGMSTQTITVGDKTTINVTLLESAESLDEVVVVGYGTQSRAEVTGAIASIDSDELAAIPVATAEQALQGRASGVTVINSGSPGTSPVVRIRGLGTVGNNGPLYVIDGVITGSLAGISTNDIESVNVLKDASTTAIYGSQGSNGVVMVTTKKGKSGKAKISFNTSAGIQTVTQRYDVLNTQQYLQYASDAFGVVPASPSSSSGVNTNWQDEIFQDGLIQNYDLSVSGGNENSNYRFSAGILDQEGTVIETGFKRYSFRANSDFSVGKLKIGETMAISFNSQNPERQAGARSLIEHAIKMAPYLSVYNADNLGGYQGPNSSLDGQDSENPVRVQSLGNSLNKTTAITGSIYGEYEIIDGLKFRTQVGLDYYTYNNNSFIPSYNDDSEGATHTQTFALINKNSGVGQTVTFTNSLNYEKTIADVHNFDVLLVAEKYENTIDNTAAESRNPISDEVDQLSNESSALSSSSYETNRIGYLARVNYNFDGKYIFAASIRRDASSRFGENNRWGTFPSLALGWNMAKEDFMADTKFSNLKLRGSWGVVGNDNISNYLYSSTLTSDFIYPIGGAAAVGTTANGLANPDLKWEETTMVNIGLDFGLFNEKITGSIEYYKNTSDDLLMSRTTPVSLGFNVGTITENVGSVETTGFELNLGYNHYGEDFSWSANLNLGTSTNEVKSLGVLEEITGATFEQNDISRITVGESLFYFYGLETDGIYQTQAEVDAVFTANPGQTIVQPGDIRFVDHNGDGDITSSDRTIIGNPYPDVTYGLNLSADYKNWDLNMFITGVAGNEIFNTNIYDLEGMPRLFNSGTAVLDRWTPTNASNSIPRAAGAPQNVSISDRFVENGSYTRLKNLSIGYTFPEDTFGKGLFSNFKVYVSGQNLVTITDYSGLDPEIGSSTVINNTAFETGIDRGNYPQPKTFLLGLQVTF